MRRQLLSLALIRAGFVVHWHANRLISAELSETGGQGDPLCVEMEFYADISCESRCDIEMNQNFIKMSSDFNFTVTDS